jgi:BirA family biotin operon repressor/biotin-[acetyl-CoA-carboxylase] ligase
VEPAGAAGETGSTNADVVEAARAGEPEGLVVVAERQTAGRGRRGRVWQSPPRAGIATSVLLRPGEAVAERGWAPAPATGYGWLPLLAGVALVETVTRLAELDAALKWPNDLLVGDAKCAGILAEAVPAAGPGDPPAIVLGIGLNVTLRADELRRTRPAAVTPPQLAGAVATDRDPLLRALLRCGDLVRPLAGAGGDALGGPRDALLAGCRIDRRYALLPGGDELTGTATGVDADGQLLVATVACERRGRGDVLHLR